IPLVQSLGHMETPLRLDDYSPLRELPERCDGLNPLAPGARELVQRMVDDVAHRSGALKHFHLGGDEAFTFGRSPQTRAYIERHGKPSLYLHPIRPILESLNARGVRPILWHDMMVEWDDFSIAEIAALADVMVWAYRGSPDAKVIERFRRAGVNVWGACAFKGADSRGDGELPDVAQRVANATAWAAIASRVPLKGIIATGWSRYQTTRVQCEPLDGALDSLVRCAAALNDNEPLDASAAEAMLASLGELERFRICAGALRRMSDARRDAWEFIRLRHEQTSLERRDPSRRESGVPAELLRLAREQIAATATAAEAVKHAFAGLVPDVWVKAFVAERLIPLIETAKTADLDESHYG
ncbi:MAG: hexosaminidase, partial [Humisphaera sp.]|nr:hexosaminidase [Humisphaera sp.]